MMRSGRRVKRILGIFAHPDDESLGCAGTLAGHVKAGDRVVIYALSDGVSSRFPMITSEWSKAVKLREQQFKSACRSLGAEAKISRVLPDQKFDTVPQLEVNQIVEKIVRRESPHCVYTHSLADLNRDHRILAEAVLVATREVCGVMCVEPEYSERGWPWHPNCVRPIRDTLAMKLKACQKYREELRPFPHRRSLKAISRQAEEHFLMVPK